MTARSQCPLVSSRTGHWCGWTRVRLSHPGAILVPSHPRGAGAPRQSCSRPLCHGKWKLNELPLHLFPVKGWAVVCTATSGPLTFPTRVTGCAKSSYEALSGLAAVPGTEGQIPTHTWQAKVMAEQPWWCPGSGAHPALQAEETQGCGSWDFTDTTQWVCGCWEGGSCRNLSLESGLRLTELFVHNICVSPQWG